MSDGVKRFWTETTVAPLEAGFSVMLDGRPMRTPAKSAFAIPGRALAEAVAAEWEAQGETVEPASMPLTRYLNSAIDRVAPAREAVVDAVAAYGGNDLLCYRAGHPQELVARQAEAWDPVLAWATERYGAPLILAEGVMHVAQPQASLAKLRAAVAECDPLRLSALHELTALSGSLLLGFAVMERHLAAEDAWARSRIDERWQSEQWGEDELAAQTAAVKRAEFLDAARLLTLLDAG